MDWITRFVGSLVFGAVLMAIPICCVLSIQCNWDFLLQFMFVILCGFEWIWFTSIIFSWSKY